MKCEILLKCMRPKLSFRKRALIISCLILVYYYLYINVIHGNNPQPQVPQIRKFVIKSNSNLTFLYNPAQTCTQRNPYLMMIIKSHVGHFTNREVLRRTWAQQDEFGLIRRVFSLGIPKPSDENSKEIEAKLRTENVTFGDLVQQDFIDDYYNNTLKTMMGVHWACEYCSKVYFSFFVC